ncbi:MAG: hypothetical protein SYR96_29920, partial [Actinomycetota bacterium]|nr:hypothetical protein [Actinomycetota bacterium]
VVGVALLVPLLAQTTLDLLGVANPPLPYPAVLIVDLARWPAVPGILLLAAALIALRHASGPPRPVSALSAGRRGSRRPSRSAP